MLYKFKSNAAADLIALEPLGKELLQIIGKDATTPGILLPEQMKAALHALKQAVTEDEAAHAVHIKTLSDEDEKEKIQAQRISLRTRAWPLVTMIERSLSENSAITW